MMLNIDEAKGWLPILTAFINRKPLERWNGERWIDADVDLIAMSNSGGDLSPNEYRVKKVM